MNEILSKLLESELLSEDTKAQISEQWTTSVEAFKKQIREETQNEVRLQLSEQWIAERDELVGKVDSLVSEALQAELAELRGDVERFRDLEAEHAEKLVEQKYEMANEVAAELDTLVDKIDAFFEARLQAEMEELKEDLEQVKKNEFGRRIFEAFAGEFSKSHVDENATQQRLNVAESKLADAEQLLAEREQELNQMIRETKMEQILAPLTGKKREQMAMMLKTVDTDRLQESYKFFIGRILKEDAQPAKSTLTESAEKKTILVTGEQASTGDRAPARMISEDLAKMKRLAGITQ
jgi:hypothetical protein